MAALPPALPSLPHVLAPLRKVKAPEPIFRGPLPIGANLSIWSQKTSLQVRSQEPVLDPRLKPQAPVQPSPGTATEKAPQAREASLHSCQTPLAEYECASAVQTTGKHQPHTDGTPQVCRRRFKRFLSFPLLQERKVGLHQALLPCFCRRHQRAHKSLPFLFLQCPSD